MRAEDLTWLMYDCCEFDDPDRRVTVTAAPAAAAALPPGRIAAETEPQTLGHMTSRLICWGCCVGARVDGVLNRKEGSQKHSDGECHLSGDRAVGAGRRHHLGTKALFGGPQCGGVCGRGAGTRWVRAPAGGL